MSSRVCPCFVYLRRYNVCLKCPGDGCERVSVSHSRAGPCPIHWSLGPLPGVTYSSATGPESPHITSASRWIDCRVAYQSLLWEPLQGTRTGVNLPGSPAWDSGMIQCPPRLPLHPRATTREHVNCQDLSIRSTELGIPTPHIPLHALKPQHSSTILQTRHTYIQTHCNNKLIIITLALELPIIINGIIY